MSDSKVRDYLKKENKFEKYVFVLFSVIVVILGILILTGYLKISEGAGLIAEHPDEFAWILIVAGVGFSIYGSLPIIKDFKYKKSSFYVFKKEYKDEVVEAKLSIVGADTISFDKTSSCYSIEVGFENVNYICDVKEKEVLIYIEAKDWYYESLTEEQQEELDNITLNLDPLKLSCDEIINKFVNFIMSNKI